MKTTNLICDILQHELALDEGRIMVYNQRFQIPTDSGLYITVGVQSMKPYSNVMTMVPVSGGLQASQRVNTVEVIEINAMSADQESILKAPFIIMALASHYSEQQQEKLGFNIASIPQSFDDTSFLEETAQMTRITIGLRVLRSYDNIKAVDYYDTFSDALLTEQGAVP